MNTAIGEVLNRAKTINENVVFVKIFSLNSVQEFAAQLNRDQLRYNFENSNGIQLSDIGGDYSPYTIELSIQEGRPKKGFDKIDLYDKGIFNRSINVVSVDQSGFILDGDSIKDDGTDLEKEWGKDIYGLTFDSISKLVETVVPMYQEAVLNHLYGKT